MNTFRFIIGMTAAVLVAGMGVQAQSGSGSGSSSSSSGSGSKSSGSKGTGGANSGNNSGNSSNKGGPFDGNAPGKPSEKPFGKPAETTPEGVPPGGAPLDPVNPPVNPPTQETQTPDLRNDPVRPGDTPGQRDNATGTQASLERDSDTWLRISGSTYEQRSDFMKGMDRIGSRADASVTKLKRQRSTYTGDPNAWDAEMKRLDDARAYLSSTSQELANATSSNWSERKERVERALERYQAAYERAHNLATP